MIINNLTHIVLRQRYLDLLWNFLDRVVRRFVPKIYRIWASNLAISNLLFVLYLSLWYDAYSFWVTSNFIWRLAAILDFGHLRIPPTLSRGAPLLISLFNLQRRQNNWETNLRSPRSRKFPKWPNYQNSATLRPITITIVSKNCASLYFTFSR